MLIKFSKHDRLPGPGKMLPDSSIFCGSIFRGNYVLHVLRLEVEKQQTMTSIKRA